MTFSQFIQLMFRFIGTARTRPDYVLYITDLIMRDPLTDEEDIEEEEDRFNPLCGHGENMRFKIFSGSRNVNSAEAAILLRRLDRKKFSIEIELLDRETKERLVTALANYGFAATVQDVHDVCTDIYIGILEALADGRKEVTPEEIGRKLAVDESVIPLLMEVENKCPLCGKSLTRFVGNKQLRQYGITDIYPANLDTFRSVIFDSIKRKPESEASPENKIALCRDCSDDYVYNPDADVYRQLVDIKAQISRNEKLRNALNRIELERQVRKVVFKISRIQDENDVQSLSLDALTIDKKIEPKNVLLKMRLRFCAMSYYQFIRKIFSDLERAGETSFELVASEMQLCYRRLESEKLTQNEIVTQMSNWVRKKLLLDDEYDFACEVVVAFFVQNCEVFS